MPHHPGPEAGLPPPGAPWHGPGAATAGPLVGEVRADVAVVGAGITGMVLAALLAERGTRVVVLERDRIGAGVTGSTTAKATALHAARYHRLAHRHGPGVAAAYATAQLAGLDLLRTWSRGDPAVAWEERPAVTVARTPAEAEVVAREVAAARRAGLDVHLVDRPDLGIPATSAARLDGQGQFDPIAFLHRCAARVADGGGVVHDRSTVVDLDLAGGTVRTARGAVRAGHVVLACGIPFAERAAFSARVQPHRSYVLALRVAGPPPEEMAITAGAPTRSLRTTPDGRGGRLLVVGGEDHVTGRAPDTWTPYRRLLAWARQHFEVEEVVHRWSAQDYESIDLLPYVGPVWPLPTRCLVATGYAKWGMTNGAAAAIALAGAVAGAPPPWAAPFDPGRLGQLRGAGGLVARNAGTARRAVADRLARGEGPRCPHLGGTLVWNPAERSWDCPLHGSRFSAAGALLQGPAVEGITPPGEG